MYCYFGRSIGCRNEKVTLGVELNCEFVRKGQTVKKLKCTIQEYVEYPSLIPLYVHIQETAVIHA